MASRPDSPPAGQDPLIDCLDIIATQGACLVPRANTPVWPEISDDEFATNLKTHLGAAIIVQTCRHVKYHGAADEWLIGHTPPEIREKHKAELKRWEELVDVTTDDDSDNDNNNKDKTQGSNDIDDIVATQGACLVPRANTPVWPEISDDEFAAELKTHLGAALIVQNCRHVKYHGAADEWLERHTPPEIREKCEAELKRWDELAGVTSDDDSDNDDNNKDKNKGGNDIDARVSPWKLVAAPHRPWRSRQADSLLTPPLSAESRLATPRRRKRRRISEEGDEEKERPAKKHISSVKEVSATAEDAVPNASQQKGRKRRRTLDVDNDEEGNKERPSKVRATTTRPSSIWLQRLRPRPRRPAG